MRLDDLIAAREPGRTLPQEFYTCDEVFAADLARVWRGGWLFAAHSCELPAAGDFVLFELAGDSVILARQPGGSIRAMHNVCRHRGSRVCTEPAGRAECFVCPYHRWRYDIDGRGPGGSLKPVVAAEAAGLIFVNFAAEPEPFEPAAAAIESVLKPHRLAGAKVAASIDYTVLANWKLVFENNRECLHCTPAHPEYTQATYDTAWADAASRPEIDAEVEDCRRRWRAMGLDPAVVSPTSQMTGDWFRANRTPLRRGWLSETLDGQEAAPRLGDFAKPDGGTSRVTTFPNFWCHASTDHVVTTRLSPLSAGVTAARVHWLVRGDAVEGRDYSPAKLTPFWHRTSEQDWALCENQHAGVASSAYEPGRFTPAEANVDAFVRWYLGRLSGRPAESRPSDGAAD